MQSMSIREGNGRPFFPVWVTFLAIISFASASIAVLAWSFLSLSHEQYRKRAEAISQNYCAVLSDSLATTYNDIDLAILAVKDELESQLDSGSRDSSRLETLIRRLRTRVPVLFALRTVSADGFVQYGNDISPGSRINLSDREYFQRLQNDPQAGLVFSRPLWGRVQQKWVIMLARRVNRRDSSFAGIVYGAIQLDKLRDLIASVSVGQEGMVTIRNSDLSILLRLNSAQNLTGQSRLPDEFMDFFRRGQTRGTYTTISPSDGIERIYSFRKIQPCGHYLHVGLGIHESLAPWRSELHQTCAFLTLFFALLGGSTWTACIAWKKLRRSEADREQVIVELIKALTEVKTLSGLLPICSKCKKIRDDSGYWNQIEAYITTHSEAQFTHSFCPECLKALYPDLYPDQHDEK